MTSRIALACILAVAVIPCPTQAQAARRRLPSRTALRAELQLTESQIALEKSIHTRYAPQIKSARRASRDSAARLRDSELREFRTILTPSQQHKLDDATRVDPGVRRASVPRVVPAKIAVPR